jgi:hypothetical protein
MRFSARSPVNRCRDARQRARELHEAFEIALVGLENQPILQNDRLKTHAPQSALLTPILSTDTDLASSNTSTISLTKRGWPEPSKRSEINDSKMCQGFTSCLLGEQAADERRDIHYTKLLRGALNCVVLKQTQIRFEKCAENSTVRTECLHPTEHLAQADGSAAMPAEPPGQTRRSETATHSPWTRTLRKKRKWQRQKSRQERPLPMGGCWHGRAVMDECMR